MRIVIGAFLALVICGACVAQRTKDKVPFPTEVVIGSDSFIDVGPPFNYYDLTFLRPVEETTDVERVSLTPPADACYQQAEIKVAHTSLNESLPSVLQGMNPCDIPEKALEAELRRRNKGRSVLSGMNISIQVQCGGTTRVIRAAILDRDIFDEHANTPRYTSWSKGLLEELDKATGQSPWEKPVLAVSEDAQMPPATPQSAELRAIADGRFDEIFGDVPDRPSVLYRLAKNAPRQPLIELTNSGPVRPAIYVAPIYPPIARAARVQGAVSFHLSVGGDGSAQDVVIDSGPKMLWQAVSDAIGKWKFTEDDSGKIVHGSIRFGLNCTSETK